MRATACVIPETWKAAAGEYLLTVDAKQGEHAARRGLRFTIK